MTHKIAGFLLTVFAAAAAVQAEPPTFSNRPPPPPVQTSPDIVTGIPGAATDRAVRARINLEALRDGRIFTSDLSPLELQDVVDFARMVRGDTFDNRSPQQQCWDEEMRRNDGRPTRLALEVMRLKCR